MSIIKYIDIFGSTVNFQYKSKQKFSTTFGGILTILYFFLVAGCFYLIGRDFFSRKKAFITSSNEYSSSLIFSKEDFAINLADENYNTFYNDKVVYFKLWENIVTNEETISNEYELVKCNNTQFNKHIGGLTNASNYFCLPKDLILSNYVNNEDKSDRIYRNFNIQIIKCHENGINNFTKEECLSDSEKDELIDMTNYAVTFYYPKVNIDVTKYKNEEAILSTLEENYFYIRI